MVAIVILDDAKTWRRYARRQHVLLGEGALIRCLQETCRRLRPDDLFFPFSQETLGRRLEAILASLGTFQQMWMSRAQYEEVGAAKLLERSCD